MSSDLLSMSALVAPSGECLRARWWPVC